MRVGKDSLRGVRRREQRAETRLREVMIGRQRIREAVLLHDDERRAICQRPRLVRPCGKKFTPTLEQIVGRRDDSVCRDAADMTVHREEIPAIQRARQSIAKFQQDKLGHDDFTEALPRKVQGQRVRTVFAVQQRDEISCVRKDPHFFGVP